MVLNNTVYVSFCQNQICTNRPGPMKFEYSRQQSTKPSDMSLPEYTVRIVSQSCDSASRKRLVRFIFTGSWLDTVPIPNDAKYADATITRFAYPTAFVNIIECDAGYTDHQNGAEIRYGDFSAAHGYYSGGQYYDRSTPEMYEKREWLNQPHGSTVWVQGDYEYIKNILSYGIGQNKWSMYIKDKFDISGKQEVVYSFVPIDGKQPAFASAIDKQPSASSKTLTADECSADILSVYKATVRRNRLDVLKFMVEEFGQQHSEVIWQEAAECDNLQIFQWCIVRGFPVDYTVASKIASESGGCLIANWLATVL